LTATPLNWFAILEILLSLRQLHDVTGGILESDELATAGQRYRIVETPLPSFVGASGWAFHQANSSAPASVNLT